MRRIVAIVATLFMACLGSAQTPLRQPMAPEGFSNWDVPLSVYEDSFITRIGLVASEIANPERASALMYARVVPYQTNGDTAFEADELSELAAGRKVIIGRTEYDGRLIFAVVPGDQMCGNFMYADSKCWGAALERLTAGGDDSVEGLKVFVFDENVEVPTSASPKVVVDTSDLVYWRYGVDQHTGMDDNGLAY